MFYCDPCATRNRWPETMFKSHGQCEVCGAPAVCNDIPSSELPTPPASATPPRCTATVFVFPHAVPCLAYLDPETGECPSASQHYDPRLERLQAHDDAEKLVRTLGPRAAAQVAQFIRDARPASRLYLADYLYDVLDGKVRPE